jgi:dTDP-4-amino-4,6-dideoxygalactose transaminase
MVRVPFVDLKIQYEAIRDEIGKAIHQVLEQAAFSGGPFVAQFEKEFANYCGCPYAIGVGSGTEALWLSLYALGITQGDEVITVPNTFIATTEAISLCGATPVFVDIYEPTYTMDPSKIEVAITPRTKAIIPVHIFGQMADMDPILEIAHRHGLWVIEDACQAHGAEYKGKRAGSIGDVGCFSFYPGKNLGAYGEAGAIVTNNAKLERKIKIIRDHGQTKKYYHELIGWNARMDGIQGAILSVKLRHLSRWNEARRNHAQEYDRFFRELKEIVPPHEAEYAKHVYHLYVLRVKDRDRLIASLSEEGVDSGIHYPVPIHLMEAYRFLGLKEGSFPLSEQCMKEFISLPMFPELTHEQIERVVDGVKRYTFQEG